MDSHISRSRGVNERRTFLPCVLLAVAFALFLAGCDGDSDAADAKRAAKPLVPLADQIEVVELRPRRFNTVHIGDQMWTATRAGSIYHSTDRGNTWRAYPIRASPPAGELQSVEMSVSFMGFADAGKNALIVTQDGNSYRSNDAGGSWTRVHLAESAGIKPIPDWGEDYREVRFDEDLVNGIWSGYCTLARTADGGRTWTRLSLDLDIKSGEEHCVNDALLDENGRLTLAAISVSGRLLTSGLYVFKSDDDGQSWQQICWLSDGALLIQSLFCPNKAAQIPHWRRLTDEMNLAEHQAYETFSYEAYAHILTRASYPVPQVLLGAPDFDLLERPDGGGRVWYDDGLLLAFTDDMGARWEVVAAALPYDWKRDFTLGPNDGWAIGEEYGVYRTNDAGKRWRHESAPIGQAYDLWVDAASARVVVAGENGIHRFENGSSEWARADEVDAPQWRLIAAGDVLWSFSGEMTVFRSEDRGLTWRRVTLDGADEHYSFDDYFCAESECVLVESSETVVRISASNDRLEVVDLEEAVSDLEDSYAIALQFTRDLSSGWLATESGRIHVTEDGGRTWKREGKYPHEYNEAVLSPSGKAAFIYGYGAHYIATGDGRTFHAGEIEEVGSDGEIGELCWLDDRRALMSATSHDYEDIFLETHDAGLSWHPSDLRLGTLPCRIGDELIRLDGAIAKLRVQPETQN